MRSKITHPKKYLLNSSFQTMPETRLNAVIEKIAEITDRMLVASKKHDWLSVAKMEAERQQTINDNLADIDKYEKNEELSNLIKKIISIDKKAQDLVKQARDHARDELIQLNKERSAAKAYQAPKK